MDSLFPVRHSSTRSLELFVQCLEHFIFHRTCHRNFAPSIGGRLDTLVTSRERTREVQLLVQQLHNYPSKAPTFPSSPVLSVQSRSWLEFHY